MDEAVLAIGSDRLKGVTDDMGMATASYDNATVVEMMKEIEAMDMEVLQPWVDYVPDPWEGPGWVSWMHPRMIKLSVAMDVPCLRCTPRKTPHPRSGWMPSRWRKRH